MNNEFTNLLSNGGLYSKVDISDENVNTLISLFTKEYSLDLFCLKCNNRSVFRKRPVGETALFTFEQCLSSIKQKINVKEIFCTEKNPAFKRLQLGVSNTSIQFVCSRDNTNEVTMFFELTENALIKIGQWPSPIDVSIRIPSKYSAMLDDYFREYKSAIELNCHGYSVGAYAYLRRIIEQLVEQAHTKAAQQPDWNDTEYSNKRIGDKIKSLTGFLPDFFVSNVIIYGLISKGIHELSEDECENMFSVLKATIEYILDETIEEKEKELKKAEISKAVSLLAVKHRS